MCFTPVGSLWLSGMSQAPTEWCEPANDDLKDCRFAWPVIIRHGSHTPKSSQPALPFIDENALEGES